MDVTTFLIPVARAKLQQLSAPQRRLLIVRLRDLLNLLVAGDVDAIESALTDLDISPAMRDLILDYLVDDQAQIQ